MDRPKAPIECGPGWKSLYEPLIDYCQLKEIPVLQVKEKFGTLRFYTGPTHDPHIRTFIAAMEAFSTHVCEECGERGVIRCQRRDDGDNASYDTVYKANTGPSRTSTWQKTLCAECREQRDQRRERHNAAIPLE